MKSILNAVYLYYMQSYSIIINFFQVRNGIEVFQIKYFWFSFQLQKLQIIILQLIEMFERMKMIKQSVKNPLNKIKQSIKDISKQIMSKQKFQLTQIIPNQIYHISYPTQTSISPLSEQIKKSHQYQIWNVSQYPYSQKILELLLGQGCRNADGKQVVYNLTYQYFANIPFCEMIKAIQNIESFLSLNPKNKVFIHCQQNKRRSTVLLQSYIYLTGVQTDFVQSILTINKLLNISFQDKQATSSASNQLYKSQHLILKNLMNYMNNSSFINKNTWFLKKILLTNTPKIHQIVKYINQGNQQKIKQQNSSMKPQGPEINFKILLQIRTVQGLLYKKIFSDDIVCGEAINLRIPHNQNLLLKDDFLIIIKYVYQKKAYSILRAQLNTNFIYDPYFRVQRKDMDLSVTNSHSKNQSILMDISLELNQNQQSQLSKLSILKDNSQKQSTNSSHEQKIQSGKNILQISNLKSRQSSDDEQDFKILDQEQQAEHNQKMQKQIQQQLKKQLQRIKSKKSKQIEEQQVSNNQQGKAQLDNDVNQQENNQQSSQSDLLQSSQQSQQQKTQANQKIQVSQKKQGDILIQVDNKIQVVQQNQIQSRTSKENALSLTVKNNQQQQEQGIKQTQTQQMPVLQNKQKFLQNQQKANDIKIQTNEQEESQQQSQDSSSEENQQQQQQDDLDNYLQKLQKQADNH